MKSVVTGGAGFIGSHLVEELLSLGHHVHVIDNLVTGHLTYLPKEAVFHEWDITSEAAQQVIIKEQPDYVFHLAAQADVDKSIREVQYDADVNIKGTINLLEASHKANVQRFIFSSTSAVYGNLQNEKLTENDPTIPISYYGLSKLTAESYIRIFSSLTQLPYTILRYGNVYGPRQTAKGEGGVIAVFLEKIKKGLPLSIHGDGEQTRDFIYVKDIVSANIAAMNHGTNDVFHVSTAQKTSVNEIIHSLKKLHPEPIQTYSAQARKGDIKHSCLANQKTIDQLHWLPKTKLNQGLTETYHALMEGGAS